MSTETIFCIREDSETGSDTKNFSDIEETCQMMQYASTNQVTLAPLLKATISIDKYNQPRKVIIFLNT